MCSLYSNHNWFPLPVLHIADTLGKCDRWQSDPQGLSGPGSSLKPARARAAAWAWRGARWSARWSCCRHWRTPASWPSRTCSNAARRWCSSWSCKCVWLYGSVTFDGRCYFYPFFFYVNITIVVVHSLIHLRCSHKIDASQGVTFSRTFVIWMQKRTWSDKRESKPNLLFLCLLISLCEHALNPSKILYQ